MPNNYDEVVEQNRKNLTKAQIAALAKAAQEYGIMNAGNRAGALASLRDQYNAGYRGLQNMGLAGGMEAQARSGEVPRLGAQLQTPFDQYNRKLMEVENKQLSALGSAFAESTKKARAAAAKAKAEAEAAAAAWAAKQKRTAEYEDPRMVYGPKGDKRVTFDKQDADLSAALAVAEIDPRMAKFQNPNFQTAKAGYAGAAGYTSAIMQKQRADAFNERRYAEYEDPRLSNPNFLAERRKERSAALAAAEIDPRTAMFQDRNFQTAKAGYAGSMRRYQAANPDPAVVARKNYEEKDAVVRNMFRAKRAGEVSDDEYRAAVVDRDIAKMHMAHPDIPIFAEIDHEAAGVNLERARNDYDSARNASGWKPQPSVDEVHTRDRVQYNHYKGLLSVLDDPNATKADKDRARTSIESGPLTVDQARNFVNKYENYSPAEEPEDVRQARENAEMAELAYNHPDAYKALYYKYNMTPEMRAKYPEVAAWVDDTIARYNMESLGIKVPTMTRSEYAHAEANAEDIRDLLNDYNEYDNRTGMEAERDATADLLMKRYHMTVDQAWDFVNNMRNQRDVWSEYDYYYAGARAQAEHNGEKPTQPVNEGENDVTYRAVNGLSRTAGYDVSLTGVHGDDGHMAEFMTPEQRDAYNAIYEKDGIVAANEYYKAITPYLNIQRAAEDEAYYKKFAREHPFLADVRSVGANLLWNIPAAAENIVTGVVGMFTKDRPYYDVNSDFSFRSGRADAIRGQRSFDILNDMSNPENVRQMQNFAYNTGMSIADSAAIMGLAYLGAPEWVTALFFGSSAGNQAYKDARARGATQDQALALGIANGIFEALFEEVSLDKVMNMDHTGRAALIKNLLTQMFVEGSEEAFTGIADTLADVLIMGDKSEFKQAKARYLTVTKTQYEDPEEAERKAAELAFWDTVKEIGMDALGGMVSGGVFALGGAAIHDARAVNHGNMMLEDRGLNDRVTRTAELFGGKPLEMLEKYQADPNVRNAGNLYMVVNETMNELFGRTEKPDVDKITPVDESAIIDRATAASALLSGDRMSVTTAENIIGVLGNEYLSAKGMNVSSPAAFANDYNARLAKYGIKSYGATVTKIQSPTVARAYRTESPSYVSRTTPGKASGSRRENRQNTSTAAEMMEAENNAAARVWQNPNMGYTTNADGSRFMNLPGNMTAVAKADFSRKNFKAQTTAKMDGVTLELAGMEARKGLTDAQIFASAKKNMTKEAAEKLDVYMKLAKALSLPMVIRDVVAGTSGYVHDGKLYVTLSGQQSIPRVVAHELTHFMKDHALQKYTALRTHLIAEVGQTRFNELVKEKAEKYGLDLDAEEGRIEADDEVCAELCERMLANPEALERLAEKNIAVATTLRDRLLKILNAIKAALKDASNRDFGRSHSDLIKQEQTVEAWLDGINEAIKNANERAKTTEGRIAQVAGVTTSDQESLIRDIKKASETAAKAKQEAAAPVRTAEKATTESKVTEKTTAESEPVKAATEADTESKKPAEAAKPAAKPRRYVRVNSTVSDRQGTTFEGGRAPRGMTDLTYKIQNATNFGSGLVTGSMSDYASFGYTSYFGNLDGDAYGYSKSTWRNAGGRAIRDSQAAVSSASDLKQGNAFVNDVLQYNFLTSEELGKANSMTEAEIADRDAAEVDVASVLSADQIAAAETVADMLAKGSEVVIQLPVTDNFDQLARATLKAVFEAMPANKRTGVSFATGLTSADISRKGGDVSLIITDKSQQQTGEGKRWIDLSQDEEIRDRTAAITAQKTAEETGIRNSLDADYMDLAEKYKSGTATKAETEQLRKAVDQAARKAGYTTKAYHGTTADFTKFDKSKIGSATDEGVYGRGFYFSTSRQQSEQYSNGKAPMEVFLNTGNQLLLNDHSSVEELADLLNMSESNLTQDRSTGVVRPLYSQVNQFAAHVQEAGYDSVRADYGASDEIVMFDSDRIKSADPVTYDDKGNIIPLSERFNAKSDDIRYSIDEDAVRQAFTFIDTEGIEDGLEALKDVKHVGAFALKDISRFLDASAGKNKDLRNTLHAIFEAPHSEATGRYARAVERMQQKTLDIGQRAGVCDAKGKHFDSKKSAAIQNIGEGFSNTYTDLKLKVKDAEHVTVQAYEPGTDKQVVPERDYTLKELRKAYGTNAADYVWDQVFHQAENAQETGGKAGWIEQKVNTRPYTLEDLQKTFPDDWQKLKGAADEFRQMYEDYIRDQNNMLATIYPIESEYADVEKLESAIEKKQERLVRHKDAVNQQLESLQQSLEAKEKAMAGKKRTDTKAYRQLVEQANKITDKIAEVKAEIAEYEANVKDELVKMNTLKAEMQNAVQKGDYSLKRMHRLQYRSDYFHHFTEMASGIQNLKSIFTNNTDIAPAIVGKSEGTRAKTKWAGYFQQRMGGDYTADALNGMLRYGQLAEYKLAFDPLTAYLRDVNKQIRDMSDDTNRDGLIRYIDQWADNIAGKSHKLDRVVSDAGMAPRKAMQILQWINSRVIQNTLLFNMRSALVQISNITNAKGIVKNNLDWMNGLRAWAMAARGDEAMASIMAQSNFLASRYMDGLELTDSKLKSVKQFAGWMLGALDEVSAKSTWWAAYQQYVRNPHAADKQYRSYDNAVDYADDVTRRTHAGRGVGELAPAMTSKVVNFVAPFQVEVNNTWQLLKDNVKQKNYLGLLSTGVSVFLFNTVFEAIVGSTPLGFDFIRAILDIVLGFTDDDDDDPTVKTIAQRFAGELVGGLPFGGQLVTVIGKERAKKLLGNNTDVTRYDNTQIGITAVWNAAEGLLDIGSGLIEGRRVNWIDDLDDLLNLTLPFGGKQLTRTAQGLATVAKGYAGKYDKKGDEKVQFVTDGTILKYIHAGLFGKWALTEASEYFGEKRLLPQLFGKYEGPKSSLGTSVDAKEYKAALATGITGKDYFTLKRDLNGRSTQVGKRAELMQNKYLTPEQKAKLDALLILDKKQESKVVKGVVYQKNSDGNWEVKADYSSNAWLEISYLGETKYEQAKGAVATGILPEIMLDVFSKWKGMSGKDKQKQAKEYLESLHLTPNQYEYIWTKVFKYKSK